MVFGVQGQEVGVSGLGIVGTDRGFRVGGLGTLDEKQKKCVVSMTDYLLYRILSPLPMEAGSP